MTWTLVGADDADGDDADGDDAGVRFFSQLHCQDCLQCFLGFCLARCLVLRWGVLSAGYLEGVGLLVRCLKPLQVFFVQGYVADYFGFLLGGGVDFEINFRYCVVAFARLESVYQP